MSKGAPGLVAAFLLSLLGLVAGPAGIAAADPAEGAASNLVLELFAAPSFDSNAAQEAEEGGEPEGDGLALLLGRAELRGRLGRPVGFGATLEAGAKRFHELEEENTHILQFSGQLAAGLGESPLSLTLGLDTKDRHQPEQRRSYRTGSLAPGLALNGPGGFSFTGRAHLLGFSYLPEPDYDYRAWGGELSARWRGAWLQGVTALRWMSLGFAGKRLTASGLPDPETARSDEILRLDLEFDQFGRVIAEQGVFLQLASSNSAGAANERLGVRGALSLALPAGLDLSVRASLLWARYEQTTLPGATDADPTYGVEDEETRSSGVLAVRRALGESWAVEARYARYFTLGDGPTYGRDVALLGLRYRAEL